MSEVPDWVKEVESGDVIWWNGTMTSHEVLVKEIDVEEDVIKFYGPTAEHGIGDGVLEEYSLSQWAPSEDDVVEVADDWSDEKKENLFGAVV